MSASLVRATVRAVSKRKLQPTRAALTLTPSAVNKIKQLLKDKPEHVGVKVGVRTRGCNGLSYTLEYTKTKGDSDEEVVQDGVRVFIEKKAQLTLLGTEMDYVEDKLSSEFMVLSAKMENPAHPKVEAKAKAFKVKKATLKGVHSHKKKIWHHATSVT
uniref:iron-sulfur cluster assembly 1 homolog, mitochondrial n=1 Tax=Urocitellus parryii TaxID=9999 RepID=UPI000E559AC7|nr:iron-sulfur cluster assembly 1 homolog, mitochondrial [Urocitellus parryii]